MKILVLLFYYNRPQLVRNALQSLLDTNYHNLDIQIIDDGSIVRVEPVVQELFNNTYLQDKYQIHYINDTPEIKAARPGSIFGQVANEVMLRSDADICVMLCDDDAIYPTYFDNLCKYYSDNTTIHYAYSHVLLFNPVVDNYKECISRENHFNHIVPINPVNSVDASQVSWRLSASKAHNITFPYPQTSNLDAVLYQQLFNALGACHYTGCVGQYKGWFDGQLGRRSNAIVYNYQH